MDITSYLLGKNSSGGGGGGADLDWTAIGYTSRPYEIDEGYDYALEIQQNWVPSANLYNKFVNNYYLTYMPLVDTSITTNMASMFNACYSLESIALLNTSSVKNFGGMFNNCYNLKNIPLIDTGSGTQANNMFNNCYTLRDFPKIKFPKSTTFEGMFTNCFCLTDTSLNNILEMCVSATAYTGTKTLYAIGIRSNSIYPVSKIQSLPAYNDFTNAGWSIGYN